MHLICMCLVIVWEEEGVILACFRYSHASKIMSMYIQGALDVARVRKNGGIKGATTKGSRSLQFPKFFQDSVGHMFDLSMIGALGSFLWPCPGSTHSKGHQWRGVG